MSKLDQGFRTFTVLDRIFEPMLANWQRLFHVGDRVKLIRPFWDLPAGAEGEIKMINPDDSKGRVLHVEFDMSPYNLTLKDTMRAPLPAWAQPYADEPLRTMSSDVTSMDVVNVLSVPPGDSRLELHIVIADVAAPTLVAVNAMPDDVRTRAYTYWQIVADAEGYHLLINAWCPDVYLDERLRAALAAPICQFAQALVKHVAVEVIRAGKLYEASDDQPE